MHSHDGGALSANASASITAGGTNDVTKANDEAIASGRSHIRARMKKRWTSNESNAAATITSTNASSTDTSKNNEQTITAIDIRAPSSGFLRIHHTHLSKAILYINNEMVVSSVILASIEKCTHPALVGTLCGVCGVDVTSDSLSVVDLTGDDDDGRMREEEEERRERRIWRREHGHVVRGGIANLNDDQVDTSQTNGNESKKYPYPADKFSDQSLEKLQRSQLNMSSTAPKSSVRSLSSLLSGAKSTQDMQQNRPRHPPPRRNIWPTPHNHPTQSHSNSTSDRNSTSHTQMTVSGGITLTISSTEAKSIAEQDARKLKENQQLCLVLDLDHTLLHATDDYRAGRFVADEVFVVDDDTDHAGKNDEDDDAKAATKCETNKEAAAKSNTPKTKPNPQKLHDVRSILLPFDLPPAQYAAYLARQHQIILAQSSSSSSSSQNNVHPALPPIPSQKLRHFVKLRPHLKEFFNAIQSNYKLSVYTAGTRAYAERIAVMICRHLVGATLDEEGLGVLRGRVRELDEEWRRYEGWVERRRVLKKARSSQQQMDDAVGDGGKARGKGKCVSFSLGQDGNEAVDAKTKAKKGVSFSVKDGKDPSIETEQLASKVDSLNVSPSKSDSNDVPSGETESKKRCTNGDGHIPRKKRKVESDSLISLIAPPPKEEEDEAANKDETNDETDKEMNDPSKERDELRKQLEKAEALEVEATSLRRKLFGSRIVSRTDVGDLGADVKSLKRVFPCGGVMVSSIREPTF